MLVVVGVAAICVVFMFYTCFATSLHRCCFSIFVASGFWLHVWCGRWLACRLKGYYYYYYHVVERLLMGRLVILAMLLLTSIPPLSVSLSLFALSVCSMQAAILSVVGSKMNEMWQYFSRFTPGFSGKVICFSEWRLPSSCAVCCFVFFSVVCCVPRCSCSTEIL